MKRKVKIKYPIIAEVTLPAGYEDQYKDIQNGEHVLLLGEITNMPGHMVLVNNQDKILWGYHREDFRILSDEET
jgi:hypothetical protein